MILSLPVSERALEAFRVIREEFGGCNFSIFNNDAVMVRDHRDYLVGFASLAPKKEPKLRLVKS